MMRMRSRMDGKIQLVAVGDISLGDCAQHVGGGVHTEFERLGDSRASYPFEHVQSMLDGSDIAFGNLETVLSHNGLKRWKRSSLEMRGHPAAVARLAGAGFNVLNVANNHMMQHGPDAFRDTVDSLHRTGIVPVGVSDDSRRACVPRVISINGLTVTVLGFAFERDKYARTPVLYAFGPDCDIAGQVAAARTSSDLVICSLHWGVEFIQHPTVREQELGRRLIDAGCDLVLGHHPHVVRRVERYGRGLIAYSLGNFVFDTLWNPWLRLGLVLQVELSRNGVEACDTNFVWIGDDYQPRALTDEERVTWRAAFDALHSQPHWTMDRVLYRRHYEALVARNRLESYQHFMRRITARPLTYTVQSVLTTARRKVSAALLGSEPDDQLT